MCPSERDHAGNRRQTVVRAITSCSLGVMHAMFMCSVFLLGSYGPAGTEYRPGCTLA